MIRRSLLSWALFLPAPLAAQSGRLAGLDAYITRAIWGSTRTRRMARRIRLLLRHGDRPSGRVFSEAASHEMRSPQTIIPLAPHSLQARPPAMFAAYGLGWSLHDYRGRSVTTHGGWTDGHAQPRRPRALRAPRSGRADQHPQSGHRTFVLLVQP